jgi:hypothetical protein
VAAATTAAERRRRVRATCALARGVCVWGGGTLRRHVCVCVCVCVSAALACSRATRTLEASRGTLPRPPRAAQQPRTWYCGASCWYVVFSV